MEKGAGGSNGRLHNGGTSRKILQFHSKSRISQYRAGDGWNSMYACMYDTLNRKVTLYGCRYVCL